MNLTITIELHCDNQSAINLANNPIHLQRSKYIDVYYHFTREGLIECCFSLAYVSIQENIADIMTKGLNKDLHHKFTHHLGCAV